MAKTIKKRINEAYLLFLYKFIYITGLAALIPMVFAFAVQGTAPWYGSPAFYFFIALAMVAFSFLGIIKLKRSAASGMVTMGKMSLIPGIAALVFFLFGAQIVYGFFYIFLPGFESVEPVAEAYVEHLIPDMGVLVLGYIVIGGILYFAGKRLKK